MTDFFVERATVADLPRISELEKQCFPDAWSEGALLSQINGEFYLTFVLKNEAGEILGYISGSLLSTEAEIFRVATDVSRRRQKIGSTRVSHFISYTKERGCSQIFLEVRESNTPARALYTSLGFTENGVRRGYYKNPKEDAILLLRH
jgi:ribosomal-protein-alanine acetyltransferase